MSIESFDSIINAIRERSQHWRNVIRSADCDEYMPGALADAIEAKLEAIAWLNCQEDVFRSWRIKDRPVGEIRDCSALIYECMKHRFKIEEDLRIKVQEYRRAIVCRSPISAISIL